MPSSLSKHPMSGCIVGDSEGFQLGIVWISPVKSASVYECGRFTCTIKQHLGQMPQKHVAGLPTQVVNDKGRSHQQSQDPFLTGIEFRADAAHSRRLRIFLRRLWLGKFGRLRSRAKLTIASFITRYQNTTVGIVLGYGLRMGGVPRHLDVVADNRIYRR
jgi:hypothetical protein